MWYELQNNFLQFDKGILYTSKALLTRSGNAIREFIEGKRVKHYKPIALVLLLAAIYVFLYQYFKIEIINAGNDFMTGWQSVPAKGTEKNNSIENYDKIKVWMDTHYSEQALLQIPIYTLANFILFRKSGYNYVQQFVFITYLSA